MADPILSAAGVRKSYGKAVALDGVSLAISPGELFGLLGPNGAGKTTLLSILSGLLPADAGEVTLAGKPFGPASRELRKLVGIGTQDLAVYPDLTAAENLRFFGKLYGLRGEALENRVDELLRSVGLLERANDRAGTFSGGMKRRLNLAVAVVHGPQVLLLDEPTTGVDPQSRNHIFQLVKELNAAGTTVIYTSHYMEEVQALCTRIAVLDAGKVKACDTLPNLLRLLDDELTLTLTHIPDGFPAALERVPGVKNVAAAGQSLTLRADALGPLLPAVAEACRAAGVTPAAMTVRETSLETVFLHLTGRGLRD